MRIIHYLFLILFFAISGCYKLQQNQYNYIPKNPAWLDTGKAFSNATSDEVFYFLKCAELKTLSEYRLGFVIYSYSKQNARWIIWQYDQKKRDFSVLEKITSEARISDFNHHIPKIVFQKNFHKKRVIAKGIINKNNMFWISIFFQDKSHVQVIEKKNLILVSAQSLEEKKQRVSVFKNELNFLQLAEYNYQKKTISSIDIINKRINFQNDGYGFIDIENLQLEKTYPTLEKTHPITDSKKEEKQSSKTIILDKKNFTSESKIKEQQNQKIKKTSPEMKYQKTESEKNKQQINDIKSSLAEKNQHKAESERKEQQSPVIEEPKVPKIIISSPKNNHHTTKSEILLQTSIDGVSSKIIEIKIFVNNKQIEIKNAPNRIHDPIKDRIKSYDIPLSKEKNIIKIVAKNEDNLTSYAEITVTKDIVKAPRGILYLLSVGVNKLEKIKKNKLNYAANDAIDIRNLMSAMEGKLYEDVKTFVYTDKSNKMPSYEIIINTLYDHLAKATKNDTVMIFLAGHGETTDLGQYIFLPRNATKRNNGNYKMSTVLKWDEIHAALNTINCTKIFILDTCYTDGATIPNLISQKPNNTIIIFTSTSNNQKAEECEKNYNGCFTHALELGLGEGLPADRNNDGKVIITEIKDFVFSKMEQLGLRQRPDLKLPNGGSNFIFYVKP